MDADVKGAVPPNEDEVAKAVARGVHDRNGPSTSRQSGLIKKFEKVIAVIGCLHILT
jgi:hypothetical protein